MLTDIKLQPIQISEVKALLATSVASDVHQARMLAAASRFRRIFKIMPPDAPGAFVFGAQAVPQGPLWQDDHVAAINCSGVGFTQSEALMASIGEGVELLSQFEQGDELSFSAACGMRLIDVGEMLDISGMSAENLRFMSSRCLHDGTVSGLPLGLCIRPRDALSYGQPAFPLGLGGGAGADLDRAMLHAVLELIERDAAALWWRGGVPGRVLPPDDPQLATPLAMLAKARNGFSSVQCNVLSRQLLILELSCEFGVPVVAALSSDAQGHGLACGLAARVELGHACHAAIKEMIQMELAQKLAIAKRNEAGHVALNAVDQRHIARHEGPGIGDIKMPLASNRAVRQVPLSVSKEAGVMLRSLAARLAASGISIHGIDLTRGGFGIAAARVFSAELQPEPSHVITQRLHAAWSLHGTQQSRYAELHPLL